MGEYTVSINAIMTLAQNCYTIADDYAAVASTITQVDEANSHLSDRDGVATAADTDVIALVDEFFEYLKTTSSRYRLAAEQLEKAAGTYSEMEGDQQSVFQEHAALLDEGNYRDYGNADWDATAEADDTERPEGTTEHASGFGTTENPDPNTQGGN
jgi:hypothetical protein